MTASNPHQKKSEHMVQSVRNHSGDFRKVHHTHHEAPMKAQKKCLTWPEEFRDRAKTSSSSSSFQRSHSRRDWRSLLLRDPWKPASLQFHHHGSCRRACSPLQPAALIPGMQYHRHHRHFYWETTVFVLACTPRPSPTSCWERFDDWDLLCFMFSLLEINADAFVHGFYNKVVKILQM